MMIHDELADLAVPCADLRPHPDNPRQGDVGLIAESLKLHGQYRPIIVNRDGTIIAGNHTWEAARQLGWQTIAAVTVDVSEDEARRLLLTDNKAADQATYDDAQLVRVLRELAETEDGLTGTGWDGDELDDLLKALDDDLQRIAAEQGSVDGSEWERTLTLTVKTPTAQAWRRHRDAYDDDDDALAALFPNDPDLDADRKLA